MAIEQIVNGESVQSVQDKINQALINNAQKNVRSVAFLGDSITEESEEAAPSLNYRNRGYAIWSMIHTSHRFNIAGIFGYPGQVTSYIYSQISNVVNSGADICFILSGANDILGSATVQEVTDTYDAMISTLKSAGIYPVFLSVFPRNDGTSTQNERAASFTNHLKTLATQGEIGFVDAATVMQVDDSTINVSRSYDGVHTNLLGGYWIGKAVANWLDANFPASVNPVQFGGVNNLVNPYFAGTGGTIGTGVTGTAPDSWTVSTTNPGTETTVSSIGSVSELSSLSCIQFDISGGDGATRYTRAQQTLTLPAGDYYLYAEYEKTGDLEIKGMGCSARSYEAPTFNVDSLAMIDSAIDFPENEISIATKTKVISVQEGQTVICYIGFAHGAGTGTVKVKSVSLTKVA